MGGSQIVAHWHLKLSYLASILHPPLSTRNHAMTFPFPKCPLWTPCQPPCHSSSTASFPQAKHNLSWDQSGLHADPQAAWTVTPLVRLQATVSSSCPGTARHGKTAGSTMMWVQKGQNSQVVGGVLRSSNTCRATGLDLDSGAKALKGLKPRCSV